MLQVTGECYYLMSSTSVTKDLNVFIMLSWYVKNKQAKIQWLVQAKRL